MDWEPVIKNLLLLIISVLLINMAYNDELGPYKYIGLIGFAIMGSLFVQVKIW